MSVTDPKLHSSMAPRGRLYDSTAGRVGDGQHEGVTGLRTCDVTTIYFLHRIALSSLTPFLIGYNLACVNVISYLQKAEC
jgi:hypothetical protein